MQMRFLEMNASNGKIDDYTVKPVREHKKSQIESVKERW